MAIVARRLRQRWKASMFMLSGLVGTLCGSGCVAPALASDTIPQTLFFTFPPPVKFINGQYAGTLQTQGKTLPITGTLEYLQGNTQLFKLHVSVDTGGQQITSDSWITSTPTVISEWKIVSTDPTTCRKEVLSGDSYPQCTAWNVKTSGAYTRECTVTVQGNKATLDISAGVSSGNQLLSQQENITINEQGQDNQDNNSTIIITSQSTTPPPVSDFALPSICTAPNGQNQQ